MQDQDVNWALNVFKFDHLLALVRASAAAGCVALIVLTAFALQTRALTDRVPFALGRGALDFFNNPQNAPWGLKDPRLCITLRLVSQFHRRPRKPAYTPRGDVLSTHHANTDSGCPFSTHLQRSSLSTDIPWR
jgi:hypothetical protein